MCNKSRPAGLTTRYANIGLQRHPSCSEPALAILARARTSEHADLRGIFGSGAVIVQLGSAVLCMVLACGEAAADAVLEFEMAAIAGEGWRASGVAIALHRDGQGHLTAQIHVAALELPAPVGHQAAIRANCGELQITARRFTCGRLDFDAPGAAVAGGLRLSGRLDYFRDTGALDWDFSLPATAPGQARWTGRLDTEGWRMDFTASDWLLQDLAAFSELLGHALPPIAGRLDLSLVARGRETDLHGLVFELTGQDLAGSNEAGTIAGEALELELRGSMWPQDDALVFGIRGAAATGEVYVEPVYASLEAHPVRFRANGLVGARHLSVDRLVVEQHETVQVDLAGDFARDESGGWRIEDAHLRLPRAELPGAYTVLLQPFLGGTPFGDLETAGLLHGELALQDGTLQDLRLEFIQVDLEDRDARLAIYQLSGELAWARRNADAGETTEPIDLRWSGGFVYGIPFGEARISMRKQPGSWALSAPLTIPLLDGALEIQAFEMGDFMVGNDTLLLDARLAPISMRALSHVLDWPPLSGQLSGTLPQLSHADGVLAIGGELIAEVFSGVVSIRELRVQRPLGPRAQLQADVDLRGLELAEVTEALAFGLMTGPLDGHVRGLEMLDWAPVAFDARVYTPPGDRSRKRISQRAVDNIANIGGGGGAGALSTGFLRFFEDFSYDAFALGCRLKDDVCEMSGLDTRDQGYIILRGRGLPRIDVVGFQRQVAWSVLVEQLAALTAAEGPEIR
jgi:hypothetical protein